MRMQAPLAFRKTGGQPRTLAEACRNTFLMEPHQVHYMLLTFRSDSIAEAFLLHPVQISQWRRRMGIPPMRPAIPKTNGARRPMGRGHPLRAFA